MAVPFDCSALQSMVETVMHKRQTKLILRHILVALLFLGISWLFYAPPWPWGRGIYFGDGQDSVSFIWFLNWWPFALSHHLPLLHSFYADWPAGTDLSWKTSVPALGLLCAPLTQRFGALLLFNMLMLASPALAGWAVYLAAWALVEAFWAAFYAGMLFLISGYEIGQNLGHLNLSFTAALPLCLFVLLRAEQGGWAPWRLGLALAALLAFEFGTSQEVFASFVFYAALGLGLTFWMRPGLRPCIRRLAPGLALGLALGLLLVSPFLLQMLRGWGAAQQNLSDPALYGNDLLASLIPTPLSLFGGAHFAKFTAAFTGNYAEQGGYYSLPLLLLLGFAAWRGSPALRLCAAMFVLALIAGWGPFIYVHGVRVLPAPWYPFAHLPLLSAMLPCRFSLYAWLAASFVLALWLRRAGWRRWVAALAVLVMLIPAQSHDRNWRALVLPPVFSSLAPGAHLLVLPLFGREMGWQYLSAMRFYLVGQGYLGTGRPAPFRDWPLFEPLWEAQYGAIDPQAFAAYLAVYAVQYVVVLDTGYGFFRPGVDEAKAAAQARALLQKAGWVTRNGALFTPGPHPPGPARIAYYAALRPPLPPGQRAWLLKHERIDVCRIEKMAEFLRYNPQGLLAWWAGGAGWLLPPAQIMCGP